jgi:two-component system, cell cycle response regulator
MGCQTLPTRGAGHESERSSRALLGTLSKQHPKLVEHVDRVASLGEALAIKLGLPEPEVERTRLAAKLHDVGKSAVPAAIINKPGPLSQDEWALVREHTVIGERMLRATPGVAHVASLVRASHERFDGSGYPDGAAGKDIPLGSRIVFVCDSFDAMTSTRAYSEAKTTDVALDELKRCAGSQFDPVVVAAFADLLAGRALPVWRARLPRSKGPGSESARRLGWWSGRVGFP